MTPSHTVPPPLVTRLLIMPDGSVLADNLTREMASCLEGLGLYPDPSTCCALTSRRQQDPPTKDRLGDPAGVSLRTATHIVPSDI